VGNLTVGGSGKTPIIIELARHFIKSGRKTTIVSSSYGRDSKENILGTGDELRDYDAIKMGDEPKMISELLPSAIFAISHSKSQAAALADNKYSPDIILVDDGFQHRRLHRDFDLLVIDSDTDLRHEYIFPLGRLREPVSAMKRANGTLLVQKSVDAIDDNFIAWLKGKFDDKTFATANFYNDEIISGDDHIPLKEISNKRVYIFAGLGNNRSFENYVSSIFSGQFQVRRFPDHCRYDPSDIKSICEDLHKHDPEYLITTLKDYVKVRNLDFGLPLYYLNLRLEFDTAADKLFDMLEKILKY